MSYEGQFSKVTSMMMEVKTRRLGTDTINVYELVKDAKVSDLIAKVKEAIQEQGEFEVMVYLDGEELDLDGNVPEGQELDVEVKRIRKPLQRTDLYRTDTDPIRKPSD